MAHPTYAELLPILQAASKRWVPELVVDPENEPAVRSILAWSCAHPKYQGDPGKGLLLVGHKGSGKTLLMRSLGLCLTESLRYVVHNTRKVTSAYNTDGDEGLRVYTNPANMLFDDLGDERTGQHYGDKVEVMSLVIQERYEHFVDRGIMTHFTTNLTPAEIKDRYGDRVYSRLKHMVNIVQVGAETEAMDRRSTAPAPKRKVDEPEQTVQASPEAAAEGFRRVREVIAEARKFVEVPKLEVVRSTYESDMIAFKAKLMEMSEAELEKIRKHVEGSYTEGTARPYLEAIDAEWSTREGQSKTA